MSSLRPIGSEKLTGQDKINRIMEIARYHEVIPSKVNENATTEYSISLADGNDYQIVKEKQGYIIKKTISESQTEYIEPMKNRKYYSSYSQAFKRLNLVAGEINRLVENEEGISLYGEQKRFVLKTPKSEVPDPAPAAAAPPAEPPSVPSPELPPSPTGSDDSGMGDMGLGDESTPESGEGSPEGEETDFSSIGNAGGEEEKVTFKTIQKITGKLTQKIRTLDNEEGMTSEDIKYVINMVLSSLQLQELSDEDKEDILSKFESDEENNIENTDNLSGDNMGGKDLTDDSEVENIQSGMDTPTEGEMEESGHGAIFDHIFKESKVDKVISKYFEVTKKEISESKENQINRIKERKTNVSEKMKSVIKLTETIEQELAAKKFLEKNSNSTFVGITNKKNLVFETKKGQVRISPKGAIL